MINSSSYLLLTEDNSITHAGAAALAGVGAFVLNPYGYVTTDTMTEVGDTALTAHTDDEGNSWSLSGFDIIQVNGTTDKLEPK